MKYKVGDKICYVGYNGITNYTTIERVELDGNLWGYWINEENGYKSPSMGFMEPENVLPYFEKEVVTEFKRLKKEVEENEV